MAKKSLGFSLVEVLVALVVFSVGLWSVADLMTSSRRTAAAADYRLQAGALAQLKLAELKASPALWTVTEKQSEGEVTVPAEGATVFKQNPHYAWKAIIRRDAATPERTDIRVEVTRAQGTAADQPVIVATGFELSAGVPAETKEAVP